MDWESVCLIGALIAFVGGLAWWAIRLGNGSNAPLGIETADPNNDVLAEDGHIVFRSLADSDPNRFSTTSHPEVFFDRKVGRYVAQPAPAPATHIAEADELPRSGFDDFMDGRADPLGAKWLNARIAGVTHRNDDGSSRQVRIRDLQPMEALTLERDPDNPFSKSAVRVLNRLGQQLGFLPDTLAWEVADAIDSGGIAEAFVRHARQKGATNYGVAIGVLFRVKLSPRNEFRRMLDARADVEEWFWAKLSQRARGSDFEQWQQAAAALALNDELTLDVRGSKVHLSNITGDPIAVLTKQQCELVLLGIQDGRSYRAIVFEVRPRVGRAGIEPVVAVMLMR